MSDRQVQARCPRGVGQLVRYDRMGKWFWEPYNGTRRQVDLAAAVEMTIRHGLVPTNAPGSRSYLARLRREQKQPSAPP